MTPASLHPLSTLCQAALQLTSITAQPASKLISCVQTPSCNRTWGKLVLLYLSAGSTLPPLPSVTLLSLSRSLTPPPPPTLPFCLSSLFRVAFLPYSPFIRERQQAKAFHKFLFSILYASPLAFLLDLFSGFPSCFLPSPYSHHIRSCVPSEVSSLRGDQHHLTLAAHPQLHRSNRPGRSQSLCVHLGMFPCSF